MGEGTIIGPDTPVAELAARYPAVRVVLSRYGFGSYEDEEPPAGSVAGFAGERGIPPERLVGEIERVLDLSRREPPPSSFLALLETHEHLNELFLLHQEALLAQDIPLAAELLKQVSEGQREHIRVEEEILLPVYARAGKIPGGDPKFYINEHRKMIRILDHFEEMLPRLMDEGPGTMRRRVIELFDEGYWFKRLLEHHDEREESILYPVLDRVTTEEERRELLERCL